MAISRKTILSRLIDLANEPAYAVDQRQRIVYCNPALADRIGATVEELIGESCEQVTATPSVEDRQSLINALCPGPAVFLGNVTSSIIVLPENQDLVEQIATFLPFTEAGKVTLILVVMNTGSNAALPEPSYQNEIRRIRARLATQYDIDQLIGVSPGILKVYRQAKLAAVACENILIIGPQGSGREQLAHTIHYAAIGEAAPFVALACQFLDDELLRTTVATLVRQQTPTGNRPTLLLVNADQLVDEAQHELLRLVADPSIDFRVVATATPNEQGQIPLLSDLMDALSTFTIGVPGLGQRPEDVRLLAEHFLSKGNARFQKRIVGFEESAVELLMAHGWPGNVNELREVIESACKVASGTQIQADELPRYLRHATDAALHPAQEDETIELDQVLATMETELIVRALRKAKSNKAQAARLLGIQRNKLLRRIEQLGIAKW